MIIEGSVLATPDEPVGAAVDVSADGFVHPVYRSGFAIALPLPLPGAPDIGPVETPSDKEALEPRPCDEPPVAMPAEESRGAEEASVASPESSGEGSAEPADMPAEATDSSDEV